MTGEWGDWDDYDGVLFDLDGVITPTADVHMHAWSKMFNAFLSERSGQEPGDAEPYTDQDYYDFVDGKPRYDGVRSFLESRGIPAPEDLVVRLGDQKNHAFGQVPQDEGVTAYPGSMRLLEHLPRARDADGNRLFVAQCPGCARGSRGRPLLLSVVHGGVAAEKGLAGKPGPTRSGPPLRKSGWHAARR